MTFRTSVTSALTITSVFLVASGSITPAPAQASGYGKALYSQAVLDEFCSGAQNIIARTPLRAQNVVSADLGTAGVPYPPPGTPATGFIATNATPYDGAEELPLTTQQYVEYTKNGKPTTVMCKMKSWDAIDAYYDGQAAQGSDCSSVNKTTVGAVAINMLLKGKYSIYSDIQFDTWTTYTGQQWTDGGAAPTAYISADDGKLHFVGKELYVDRANPSPYVAASKKGVHYCHLAAPEYVKNLLSGKVDLPVCDAPPTYAPPVGGPPQAPIAWQCGN
jgi:hypothetical protein